MLRHLMSVHLPPMEVSKLLTYISCKALHSLSGDRFKRPNTVLKELIESNRPVKALLLFRRLRRKGSSTIDSYTLVFALKACSKLNSPLQGKQLHAYVVSLGFASVIFLQTAMMNMYSVMGNLGDVHRLFDEISKRNIVCRTALISACVNNGRPRKALEIFRQMQMEGMEPDKFTVTITLSACADLGALDVGEWIHAYVRRKQDFCMDLSLQNALINMYSKCGDIKTSRILFDGIRQKDTTTWTSMIMGHAVHGQANEALRLFTRMRAEKGASRSIPNEVTYIGVLMACSHAGLGEEGLYHLESMEKEYNLKPRISHYGCLVDLFCRSGQVDEAYKFINNMPIRPNAVIWRTVLGACSHNNGNIELAELAQQRLIELEPDCASDCVAISNTYAAAGLWGEKAAAREQTTRQRRTPGCSLIEVESRVREFVAADKKHF